MSLRGNKDLIMAYFKTGKPFWSMEAAEVMERLQASSDGLTASEAAKRIEAYGPNLLRPTKKKGVLLELLEQFKSPLILSQMTTRSNTPASEAGG
ncbi:MAG: cation-transporting P-type ATPase [Thermacetogeniaceae bacterium]